MKLVTFQDRNGERHIGALLPGQTKIVDFTAADPAAEFASMLALIDGGPSVLARAKDLLDAEQHVRSLSDVRLLAPLPEPRQMRDFMAFEGHVRNARANRSVVTGIGSRTDPSEIELPVVWYEQPLYYKCNRMSVVGPDADIRMPSYTHFLDYELELGFVIGRTGRDITVDDARSHIFGYTIFNDVSARDAQMREMQGQLGPAKGKDFDTGNVIGPWLVTADEIGDPYGLTMVARVNGEERSRGHGGTMYHKLESMIAHVSRDETLHAGEFLATGTVQSGSGMESGRFLKPLDVVELEITGLGVLRNRIVK